MEYIQPKELQAALSAGDPWKIIDIRESYELEICQLNQAAHIPMAEVSSRLHEIPESGKVAILCKSGRRATAVANMLIEDYARTNVSIVDGGILAWIETVEPHLESY